MLPFQDQAFRFMLYQGIDALAEPEPITDPKLVRVCQILYEEIESMPDSYRPHKERLKKLARWLCSKASNDTMYKDRCLNVIKKIKELN